MNNFPQVRLWLTGPLLLNLFFPPLWAKAALAATNPDPLTYSFEQKNKFNWTYLVAFGTGGANAPGFSEGVQWSWTRYADFIDEHSPFYAGVFNSFLVGGVGPIISGGLQIGIEETLGYVPAIKDKVSCDVRLMTGVGARDQGVSLFVAPMLLLSANFWAYRLGLGGGYMWFDGSSGPTIGFDFAFKHHTLQFGSDD